VVLTTPCLWSYYSNEGFFFPISLSGFRTPLALDKVVITCENWWGRCCMRFFADPQLRVFFLLRSLVDSISSIPLWRAHHSSTRQFGKLHRSHVWAGYNAFPCRRPNPRHWMELYATLPVVIPGHPNPTGVGPSGHHNIRHGVEYHRWYAVRGPRKLEALDFPEKITPWRESPEPPTPVQTTMYLLPGGEQQ